MDWEVDFRRFVTKYILKTVATTRTLSSIIDNRHGTITYLSVNIPPTRILTEEVAHNPRN